MRRSRLLALAVGAAFLVAGCTPADLVGLLTDGRLPDGFGAVPTTGPFSPAPSVPFSPAPSAPESSDQPAGWTDLEVPNETLVWAAPPAWTTVDVSLERKAITDALDGGTVPKAYRVLMVKLLKAIDDGYLRMVIRGSTPGGTATSDVSLSIGPQVPDLAAAAAAMRGIEPELPDATMTGPTPVSLALGDGLRYQWEQLGVVAAPYMATDNVAVVALLPDGRAVWVGGSAPLTEDGWAEFVTQLADKVQVP